MTKFTKDPSTHPANGPLTEERLIRVREWLQSSLAYSEGSNRDYMMADAVKAIDELLAVRRADTGAIYQLRDVDWYDTDKQTYDAVVNACGTGRIVYTAPQLPQQAVPTFDEWCSATDNKPLGWVKDAMREAYDGCRSAMLQSPTTIQPAPALDLLPKTDESLTTIKPVSDLFEVTVPSGRSTTFTTDAEEAKDCADMGWKVQEYVTLERYQEAMLQGAEPVSQPDELPMDYQQGHKDGLEWAARLAESNHPQTGDWLYDDPLELAKAIRKGPDMPTAPVQGWIPCSERMPQEVGRYWCYVEEQNSLGKSHYQWNCSWNGDRWWVESENGGRVTHWMPLPAAPQQEVKP